jgi:hypothetical protein
MTTIMVMTMTNTTTITRDWLKAKTESELKAQRQPPLRRTF